jgi:hypothetical protein
MFGIARLPKLDNENRIPVALFEEREIRFFFGQSSRRMLFFYGLLKRVRAGIFQ